MIIDTPRGPFVIGRITLPSTSSPVQIERAISMAAWAAERGDREAEAFYVRRAADLASRRGASSGP